MLVPLNVQFLKVYVWDLRSTAFLFSRQPIVSGASQYPSHIYKMRVMGTWVSQFVGTGKQMGVRAMRAAGHANELATGYLEMEGLSLGPFGQTYLAPNISLDVEICLGLTWNGPCILISKRIQQ